jgi:hypothetical protein
LRPLQELTNPTRSQAHLVTSVTSRRHEPVEGLADGAKLVAFAQTLGEPVEPAEQPHRAAQILTLDEANAWFELSMNI